MDVRVIGIEEETDWSSCDEEAMPSSPQEEDKLPKKVMVELKSVNGYGRITVPQTELPNAKVGDRYSVSFGAKNTRKV